jgi:hypothetical protein
MQPLEEEVPIGEDHPSVEELIAFLRGEVPRAVAKSIVRHLLTGCPRCGGATSRYWQLVQRPAAIRAMLRERGRLAMMQIEAAREELRDIVRTLEEVRSRLLGIQASLPLPPRELARLLEDDEEDVEIEIHSVIGCVLTDSIEPAIRDLQDAAVYGLAKEEEGETGAQENASGEETE